MASGSTAFFQAIQYNSLPQFMFKQTPHATCGETFADKRGPLLKFMEYYISELKTVATKDKKLGEVIGLLETSRETEKYMQQKAKRIRLEEDAVSDEDDSTDSRKLTQQTRRTAKTMKLWMTSLKEN